MSKINERVLEIQIKSHALSFHSSLLCGSREGYETQYATLRPIDNCKKTLDRVGIAGVLFIGLTKAFGCLHDVVPLFYIDGIN